MWTYLKTPLRLDIVVKNSNSLKVLSIFHYIIVTKENKRKVWFKIKIKIYDLNFIHEWILLYSMIPLIYYKLKYIFRMFYNKVHFIFCSMKPLLSWKSINSITKEKKKGNVKNIIKSYAKYLYHILKSHDLRHIYCHHFLVYFLKKVIN